MPREDMQNGWDCITIRTSAPDGSILFLAIRKLVAKEPLAEVTVHVKLPDGTTYKLPRHPDTVVGVWENSNDCWSAGGLKIQVLEPEFRLRILYNGLLTRVNDNAAQHVRLNMIWSSATPVVRHPQDWSDELSVQALESAPRQNGSWSYLLGKSEDGNWVQWGIVQGRFQSYDSEGVPDRSEYLRTRGVRERSWAGQGYYNLRRSITVTLAARDGTAIQIRANSIKNSSSQSNFGSIRCSDFTVQSLTYHDLDLSVFGGKEEMPKELTMNVRSKDRSFKVALKINSDGGKLLSGVPYQYEVVYRTLQAEVDGEVGTGILEFGYEPTVQFKSCIKMSPARTLRWLDEKEAGKVGYCLTFENRAAACPGYVGGKGASLALLASIQNHQDYRVPPGFCLTIYAMEKQFNANLELKRAVEEIQIAIEDYYDETTFKLKCTMAAELIATTEITTDVRDLIITHLGELRVKAKERIQGSDIRFAVRSSAVGEDSEVLSAAGQNETILGCVTDADVLQGVQKCWASMFSFTSVYYRRQNGQPCLCGGGVVIQALVAPQVAGVMFTRHPDAGDPSRLLITANYGLGESVVSGSVEPDTLTVRRGQDHLSILKIQMGSKTGRVICGEEGVVTEKVQDTDSGVVCLTEEQALRLAKIGTAQEESWGAGRDIEWAISDDQIYLLQARPITSLERWTEEELLHELDFPIMADDELLTTANIGEVMPKPMSPLTHDFIGASLAHAMSKAIIDTGLYDRNFAITHNKGCMALYNSTYRHVPEKPDKSIHLLEMTVHGHKVADDEIFATARRRRAPHWKYKMYGLSVMMKSIWKCKSSMKHTMKNVVKMTIDEYQNNNPLQLLNAICELQTEMGQYFEDHFTTSYASIGSQLIAISVLLEGSSDFTADQCSEICTLMSSGDTLSGQVPMALDALSNALKKSDKVGEFIAQDATNAMPWLKKNLPEVFEDVCAFLKKYGHRSLMEFDLATKPWALVPEEMMVVLQNMCASKNEHRDHNTRLTDEEIIASLKTPRKSSTRKILLKMLPFCRRTVTYREATKAHLILAIHKIRLAFIRLAKLLVKDWYLPEYELIFFFRLQELRDYINNRDPALLAKY